MLKDFLVSLIEHATRGQTKDEKLEFEAQYFLILSKTDLFV
jgi:hypothetical protein